MRLFKEPFVHFVLLGALIFVVYGFSQRADEAVETQEIVVDALDQQWMYDNFNKQFGRAPTAREMDALIANHISTEVKYREAVAMGMDVEDSIVRRRMAQKFDFLFGGSADDATPEDPVLLAWYNENLQDYAKAARISFAHVWFNPDDWGAATESEAGRAVEQLRAGEALDSSTFPATTEITDVTKQRVRASLGREFSDAVFALSAGEWHGPIASGLGYHAVRVRERSETTPIPFEEVRDRVLADWRAAESERLLLEMIANLQAQYSVQVDESSLEFLQEPSESSTDAP